MKNWWDKAACRDQDTETFFSDHYLDVQKALLWCSWCPVREECLQFAIDNDEDGTWGGMTRVQRTRFVNRMKRAKKPASQATLDLFPDAPPLGTGTTHDGS